MIATALRRTSDSARSILGARDSTLSSLAFFPRQRASMIVGPLTEVCVEGYPRSANTFACAALENANPGIRLANHVHQPGQVIRAVRLDVPSVILIREPSQAIASLYAFNAGRSGLCRLIADYTRFYEAVLGPASDGRVGVCRFEDATASTTIVSEMLNERFGTELAHCSMSVDELRTSLARFDGGFDHDPDAVARFGSLVSREEVVARVRSHRAFPDASEVYRAVLGAGTHSRDSAGEQGKAEVTSRESEVSATDRRAIRPFVVMGPAPPPVDGVALSTQRVTEILAAEDALAGVVDITNKRSLELMGGPSELGAAGVAEGIRQGVLLGRALLRNPEAGLYKPLSPNRAGLLRDSLMIFIADLFGRKSVVHLHSSEGVRHSLSTLRGAARIFVSAALRRVDQAWLLTPTLRVGLTPPFRPEQLKVIPNFGDEMRLDRAAPAETKSRPFRLLQLGNFIPSKGYPELLAALRDLAELDRGLDVRLVGSVPTPDVQDDLNARLADVPESVGVEVRASVPLDARAEEFAWADAFVLPTSYPLEGQPLVILEALSAGLPVVSTIHAGIPETVQHGAEAILVNPGDTHALVSAIRRLAEDSDLLARMSRAARTRYEAEFTSEHYAERIRELLHAV